ncbi:MAG: FkbM family methyltransferase [Phycisphaerales bacterium]|nr:FkbM family methyltransferase [Phycisphaerales bacterium]
MPALNALVRRLRSSPTLRRSAHAMVRLVPDIRVTVNKRAFGPLRFRLRRNRWFLWEEIGDTDAHTIGTFDRLIRDGDVVYDIGANIGLYTRVMRQWCHAGPIVAIEPMGENFELLEENLRLGGMTDVIAIRGAVSDRNGEESLQVDDVTSGTAVLDSVSGGQASSGRRSVGLAPRTETVPVWRLDDLIEQRGLPAPAMMKIDTEGAEVAVLAGAEQTLRTASPRLAIALHGPDKAAGTIELLDAAGYQAYGYVRDEGESALAWRRLAPEDSTRIGDNNIVAARDPSVLVTEIEPRHAPR